MDSTVLEQVCDLVSPLNAEQRLTLIQAITVMEPAQVGSLSSVERQRQLAAEQSAWYARPPAERHRFRGEFVAVRDGQVFDHDPDQRLLYLRVRDRFGHSRVLIIPADWTEPPVYTIHSPRLEP